MSPCMGVRSLAQLRSRHKNRPPRSQYELRFLITFVLRGFVGKAHGWWTKPYHLILDPLCEECPTLGRIRIDLVILED
jgi:hypothetical protein